jgi:outer membrane lipoprotein-sorting protein
MGIASVFEEMEHEMLTPKVVFCCLLAAALMANAPRTMRAESDLVNSAAQAWSVREKSLRSLAAAWELERLIPAKTVPHPTIGSDGKMRNEMLPLHDIVQQGKELLWLMGPSLVRYEYHGPQNGGNYEDSVQIMVNDGAESKTYLNLPHPGEESHDAQRGFVDDASMFMLTRSTVILPVVILFRPSLECFGNRYDVSKYNITGRTRVAEKDADVFERISDDLMDKTILYLDRADNWVPLRLELFTRRTPGSDGDWRTVVSTDYQYAEMSGTSVALSGWTIITYGAGSRLINQHTAKITEWKVNQELPKDLFSLEFPPGTKVTSMKKGKLNERHLVLADGSNRPIEASAGTPVGPRGGIPWLWLNVSAIVVIVVCIAYRRLRRTTGRAA